MKCLLWINFSNIWRNVSFRQRENKFDILPKNFVWILLLGIFIIKAYAYMCKVFEHSDGFSLSVKAFFKGAFHKGVHIYTESGVSGTRDM